MFSRRLKTGYFVLEWLNICAVCFYINYVFFHLRTEFGFGNRENLFFAAVNGFFYIFCSWFGGKFAQRHGYFTSLYLGFGLMAVAMAMGLFLQGLGAQYAVMLLWTVGTCFTWPTLEALSSEGETRAGLSRMIGIYNVVWASGAALAYFSGGALLAWLGPRSLFWLPAGLHVAQLLLTFWLHRQAGTPVVPPVEVQVSAPSARPASAAKFLRLAWLANPFAYIAMNTIIPVVPDLAAKMHLSTEAAGVVASVWLFARFFAFIGLWWWTGWHYRFGWLATAFGLMIASFAALLLVPNLTVIITAQVAFGLSVGLIYYSSLFYSMDVGETKGEHGGFHEALIGLGLFGGPAVGAAALQFLPATPQAGIVAVSALLLLGLGLLFWVWRRKEGD